MSKPQPGDYVVWYRNKGIDGWDEHPARIVRSHRSRWRPWRVWYHLRIRDDQVTRPSRRWEFRVVK